MLEMVVYGLGLSLLRKTSLRIKKKEAAKYLSNIGVNVKSKWASSNACKMQIFMQQEAIS